MLGQPEESRKSILVATQWHGQQRISRRNQMLPLWIAVAVAVGAAVAVAVGAAATGPQGGILFPRRDLPADEMEIRVRSQCNGCDKKLRNE